MPSSQPAIRLRDIIDNIDWIMVDTDGLSYDDFAADRKTQDSVFFCLLRLAEAAKKLEGQIETLVPDQPWGEIRALGNHLRHGYDDLDLKQIWYVIEHELETLKQACEQALESL